MRKLLAVGVISTFSSGVVAQFNPQLNAGTSGIYAGSTAFNASRLCDLTFADANASGVYTFDPYLSVGQTLLPNTNTTLINPVSWAQTVYQSPNKTANTSLTELSLWFSPQGKNYSDNFDLGYDVCYLWINGLSINSHERGQNDTGNCLQTLNEECVSDLQTQTSQYAIDLVGSPSPGPNSNLSTNSLPTVCGDIAETLTQNFPQSCEVFFNSTRHVYGSVPALGGPLTGPQSYVSRARCQMNGSFSMMWSQYGPPTLDNYLLSNYWVTPLITAFMPIADNARPIVAAGAKSFTTCLRAKNLNEGSLAIPPAPLPTPIDGANTSSLSTGAIAGIVVAAILGLALLAAVVTYFIFRRRIQEAIQKRKTARRSIAELDGGAGYVEMDRKVPAVEAHGHSISEMGSPDPRAELADRKEWVSELPAYSRERQAINRHPAELGG